MFVLWTGFSASAFADRAIAVAPIDITQDAIISNFAGRIEVFRDAPSGMRAEQALVSRQFSLYDEPLVNLGAQQTPAWIRFAVRNATDDWGAWILNSLRSNVQVLEIYRADENGIRLLFDNGNDAQRRDSLDRHFNLVAPLNLGPGESTTILVRFQAAVAGWLPMRILPAPLLTRFTFSQFSFFIFSVAGTGVLIFFNLLMFLATNDRIYILYTAATGCLLLACLHLQGMTTAWWFYASPAWGRTFGATMVDAAALLLLTFARRFLNLEGRRLADAWYKAAWTVLAVHLVALTGTMLMAPQLNDTVVATAWVSGVIVFISLPIQAFVASPGWRLEETLLGIAWTILSGQFVWLMLSGVGVVPASNLDWYLIGPACFTEAALVAVSIALRVRRLQVEKERADLKSTLALQEMSERARMVLAASHDARNLVSGALSLSHRVSEARDLSAARADAGKVTELLDNLRQSMNLMVNNHRQVGFGTLPMIETIDIPEFFETLVLTFREQAEDRGMRITWRSDAESVACDRHMLMRVLSNLIINAITYSRGQRILLTCRSREDRVSFRVFDQGPGLTQGSLARVMAQEKSVRLSPESEGVGVGLSVCTELAAAFGGELEAASRPGGATLFGLTLPAPDLSTSPHPIRFLGDPELWKPYASLLQQSQLVNEHDGNSRGLYIFSENVDVARGEESINVVACYDRAPENRRRWARVADAILCFPVTLPALAYAIALATHRHAEQSVSP